MVLCSCEDVQEDCLDVNLLDVAVYNKERPLPGLKKLVVRLPYMTNLFLPELTPVQWAPSCGAAASENAAADLSVSVILLTL